MAFIPIMYAIDLVVKHSNYKRKHLKMEVSTPGRNLHINLLFVIIHVGKKLENSSNLRLFYQNVEIP